jgi:hypothetical protein
MRFKVPVLLLLLIIGGCSKHNNDSSPSSTFSATIGSSNFQGTTTLAAYSVGIDLLAVISYSVHPNDTSAFQITMPWPPPVNKPFPADSLLSLSYTAKGVEYDAWSSLGQLQLTVTSIDSIGHKIGGSFSAVGHSTTNANDSVVITNGKFSTSYNVNP